MRHLTVVFLASALAYAACAQLPDRPAAASAADVRAVADLVAEFDRCAREGDLETFLSYSVDDVVSLAPDQSAIVGKEAMRAWYADFYGAFDIDMTHHPGETFAYGNVLVHRGNATGTLKPKAGEGDVLPFDNKYMFVLLRTNDGSLKVWRAAFNANTPPPSTE